LTDDPGLQPQRTTLAWTRTAIGCGGLAALQVRQAVLTGHVIDVIAASVAAVATLSMLVLGRRRRDRIASRITNGQTPVTPGSVAAAAALVFVIAIVVIGSIVVEDFS
jgi:uncharacterized membrane protein YidH (DUF202 family)